MLLGSMIKMSLLSSITEWSIYQTTFCWFPCRWAAPSGGDAGLKKQDMIVSNAKHSCTHHGSCKILIEIFIYQIWKDKTKRLS